MGFMRRSAVLLLVVHTKALVRRAGIQAQYKMDNGHFSAPVSYIYIYVYINISYALNWF